LRRLAPDPGETTVERQLDAYRPWEEPRDGRPFVAANFAVTLDGRATIGGTSGAIGSNTDTAMLVGLRGRFDAVMIGAGTMRAERYGDMVPRQEVRDAREALGLPPVPLMILVSGRLDLPWDAPLFADGGGRVLIFTSSETEPPETTGDVRVVRQEGSVDLSAALRRLHDEHGVRALLCEGGPRLHGQLWAAGLVDEVFLTMAPRLTGGDGPRIVEGQALPEIAELELAWLLEENGELFSRYRRR
jgi:riboflavin-specific deaminase-like protein